MRSNRLPLTARTMATHAPWEEPRRNKVSANATGSSAAEARSQMNSDWASKRATDHQASGLNHWTTAMQRARSVVHKSRRR